MCKTLPIVMETFSRMAAKSPVSKSIEAILLDACIDNRVTIGLLPAIKYLSCNSGALFCVTVPKMLADSAQHMQEVLLKAFCIENGIGVVQVDSARKLKNFLHPYVNEDISCILIHGHYTDPYEDMETQLSMQERELLDYCARNDKVIRLPEK